MSILNQNIKYCPCREYEFNYTPKMVAQMSEAERYANVAVTLRDTVEDKELKAFDKHSVPGASFPKSHVVHYLGWAILSDASGYHVGRACYRTFAAVVVHVNAIVYPS